MTRDVTRVNARVSWRDAKVYSHRRLWSCLAFYARVTPEVTERTRRVTVPTPIKGNAVHREPVRVQVWDVADDETPQIQDRHVAA